MISFREYLDAKAAYGNGNIIDEGLLKKAAVGGAALLLGLGAGNKALAQIS